MLFFIHLSFEFLDYSAGGGDTQVHLGVLRLEYEASTQKNYFWHSKRPKKIIFSNPKYPKVMKSLEKCPN